MIVHATTAEKTERGFLLAENVVRAEVMQS